MDDAAIAPDAPHEPIMLVVLLRLSFNTLVGNRPVTAFYGHTGYPMAVAAGFLPRQPYPG